MLAARRRRAMASDARLPTRLNQPISLERPDQTLFNEAVLIYSNAGPPRSTAGAPLRAGSGPVARRGRPRPQHGAAPHPQPRAAGARPGATCRSGCTASRSSSARRRRTSRWTRSTGCSAGRSRSSSQGCSFTYDDTKRAGADPHLREPRASRWSRAGWPRPKHRASLLSPSFQRLGAGVGVDPPGRPAATSTWCRTSPTEPRQPPATWVPGR